MNMAVTALIVFVLAFAVHRLASLFSKHRRHWIESLSISTGLAAAVVINAAFAVSGLWKAVVVGVFFALAHAVGEWAAARPRPNA